MIEPFRLKRGEPQRTEAKDVPTFLTIAKELVEMRKGFERDRESLPLIDGDSIPRRQWLSIEHPAYEPYRLCAQYAGKVAEIYKMIEHYERKISEKSPDENHSYLLCMLREDLESFERQQLGQSLPSRNYHFAQMRAISLNDLLRIPGILRKWRK